MPAYRESKGWDFYCPCCGIPFARQYQRRAQLYPWLTGVKLATTGCVTADGFAADRYRHTDLAGSKPHVHSSVDRPNSRLYCLEGAQIEASQFKINASGANIIALYIDQTSNTAATREGGSLYVPIHARCMELARRFLLNPDKHSRLVTAQDLWEWIISRATIGGVPGKCRNMPCYLTEEPNSYFLPESVCDVNWAGKESENKIYMADPVCVPTLTSSILDCLEPVSQSGIKDTTGLGARLRVLPTELQVMVSQSILGRFEDLAVECNYVLPQSWWRDRLLDASVLPWLWDVDAALIASKEVSCPPDHQWNWELVVRKLSQSANIDASRDVLDCAPGLRNRQRIWRVLSSAR